MQTTNKYVMATALLVSLGGNAYQYQGGDIIETVHASTKEKRSNTHNVECKAYPSLNNKVNELEALAISDANNNYYQANVLAQDGKACPISKICFDCYLDENTDRQWRGQYRDNVEPEVSYPIQP
jgi:hypothetical protein